MKFNLGNNAAFLYLHGGPFFKLSDKSQDPYLLSLVNKGYTVIAPNYKVSKANCDNINIDEIKDFQKISDIIRNLRKRYERVILIGDSYGAYLATLLCNNLNLDCIICISGFISILYESLFSKERELIHEIFRDDSKDFVKVTKLHPNLVPVFFIQGTNDDTCPINQFSILSQYPKATLIKLFGYAHREQNKKHINNINNIINTLVRPFF